MWSMHAFASNMATTVLPLPVPPVLDQSITSTPQGFVIGKNNILLGGSVCYGAAPVAGNYARFLSPSLRRLTPQNITPINLGITHTDPHLCNIDNYQLRKLDQGEILSCELGGAIVAIDQKAVIAVLSEAEVKEVYGEIIEARVQVTIAQNINAWTQGTIAFMDTLPVGTYDVVGMDVVNVNAIAFRLIFVGQTDRPGFFPRHLPSATDNRRLFRRGRMGVWGTFTQDQIPQIEVLGSAALGSATFEGTIDLMVRR